MPFITETRIVFIVRCDWCGHEMEDEHGSTALWMATDAAEEEADGRDWYVGRESRDTLLVCNSCRWRASCEEHGGHRPTPSGYRCRVCGEDLAEEEADHGPEEVIGGR